MSNFSRSLLTTTAPLGDLSFEPITNMAELPHEVLEHDIDMDQTALHDEMEMVSQELMQLGDTDRALEALLVFGVTPSAIAVGQASGLLDKTGLESVGCESFGNDAAAQMGIESILDAIKTRSAGLLERITNHITKMSLIWNRSADAQAGAILKQMESADATMSIVARTSKKKLPSEWSLKVAGKVIDAWESFRAFIARALELLTNPKECIAYIRSGVKKIKWPFGQLSIAEPTAAEAGRGRVFGKLMFRGKPAKSAVADFASLKELSARMAKTPSTPQEVADMTTRIIRDSRYLKIDPELTKSIVQNLENTISKNPLVVHHANKYGKAGAAGIMGVANTIGDIATKARVANVLHYGAIGAALSMLSVIFFYVGIGGMRVIRRVLNEKVDVED